MKRHSEEQFSIEPEVGVVIAKKTTQQNRLIRRKYQFRKTKKALTVICTILFHILSKFQTNYNIFQQSVTQWSPSINNKTLKKKQQHTLNYGSNSVSKIIHKDKFGTIQWFESV